MDLRRLKYLCFLAFGLSILAVLYFLEITDTKSFLKAPGKLKFTYRHIHEDEKVNPLISSTCPLASLDPWNKDVLPYYSQPVAVNCATEFNKNSTLSGPAFEIRNGRYLYRLVNMEIPCCFRNFHRKDDERISYGNDCMSIGNRTTLIPNQMDYIAVFCREGGQIKYQDAFAVVQNKLKYTNSNEQAGMADENRLNIILIGLDAVSRVNFLRQMPLSNNFLLNEMAAISLDRHSVVGAGSSTNIIPMLTGLSQQHLVNRCGTSHWDERNCPFIWNQFSERGYVTTFAEDYPIFNENWPRAFKNPPTNYYLRPYVLYMDNLVPKDARSHLCLGPRLAIEMMLDFTLQVAQMADEINAPYFQFSWTTLLAHDNKNNLGLGDAALAKTLVNLTLTKSYNRTVVIVLGDHGEDVTGNPYYGTISGKLEYRMPVAYVALPLWFKFAFPYEYRNLVKNAKRMTTSFDIYNTLLDLMNLEKLTNKGVSTMAPGISLFGNIPKDRHCLDAGTPLQWCVSCYPTIPVNVSHSFIQTAAMLMVAAVNNSSKPYRSLCAAQSFGTVKDVSMWDSRDVFREICEVDSNKITDHPIKRFGISCKNIHLVRIMEIVLTTKPSAADYHAQVIVIKNGNYEDINNYKVFVTDKVRRIDWYSEKGKCVRKPMQPFCICKDIFARHQ